MHNTQSSLLWQLIQSINDENTPELPEPPIPQNQPFDILFKLRPVLSAKEQRYIDLIIKIQEIKILMDEIQSDSTS